MSDLSNVVVLRTPHGNAETSYVEIIQEGTRTRATDFVVIYAEPDGGHTLIYNTDSCTMGIASTMLEEEANKLLDKEPSGLKNSVLLARILDLITTFGDVPYMERESDEQD